MEKMIDKCRTVVLIILAPAIVAGPALAQAYSNAGAWTSGGGSTGQFVGGGVSAGPGGVKTFSLGSGYTYSITSVSPADAQQLQSQGVRVLAMPAGKIIYVSSQAGQPLDINAGNRSAMPNMIVFGPKGFTGTGIWAGPGGAGVISGPGVSIANVPGAGASIQVGGGAGTGGVSINAVTGVAPMQMYSFTGSPGDTYLITQQSGGMTDRVLVTFQ
jgi:hypothetical protein